MNVALTFNAKPEDDQPPENAVRQYNDVFAEWDNYHTIHAVRDALAEYHNVTLIEADENAFEKLRTLRPDIVFNIAEGKNGISREAQIPAMLDMLGIPYTGSDPLTLASCLDKCRTKEVLLYNGIPTPRFISVASIQEFRDSFMGLSAIDYPVIIKPSGEGSSKGIFNSSLTMNNDEAEKLIVQMLDNYRQPVIIEEFLSGREFTVAIIGNGQDAEVLPVVEINFDSLPGDLAPIYSYEAKWVADNRDHPLEIFSCPASLSSELAEDIRNTTLKAYNALRCRDWSRIDIRLDAEGKANIIEINPLPGILPDPEDNSCFPKSARTAGLTYNEMIMSVLDAAVRRYGMTEEYSSGSEKSDRYTEISGIQKK